jgi:hypothetical protein
MTKIAAKRADYARGLDYLNDSDGLSVVSETSRSVVYHDDAMRRCYRVTYGAVVELGEMIRLDMRDVFSHWCAGTVATEVGCKSHR